MRKLAIIAIAATSMLCTGALSTNRAEAATFGPAADPYLAGPIAHSFTGAACNSPAMLAQIPPATTPETYYICPA